VTQTKVETGAPVGSLDELAVIRARASADPIWKADHLFGFHAWSKQREILRAVRAHSRVAVRSCHGVGKTAVAAIVVLDFLSEHPRSRVITTAPTFSQVEQLLWREIRGRYHKSALPFGGRLTNTKLELADDWFALGLSTNEPDRFQGHHSDHLLLVVDEASGVDEEIYEAAEGFLTNTDARTLLIGNPTQLTGQFHRAFTSERALWNTIGISAFDSPNLTGEQVPDLVARALVSKSWVDDKRIKWGEQSPAYQVRVLGEFASTADDTVCSLGNVEAAQQRSLPRGEPVEISCDVARFGSDETVIAVRYGQKAWIVETYTKRDTMETTGRVIHWAAYHHASRVVVDEGGLGGGVVDRLREQRLPFEIEAFNGAQSPVHATGEYPTRRSEAWFALSEQLPGLDLDPDEMLLADLVAPSYKFDSSGRRVVEPKDETKKRLGRSPDRGDAFVMLFAPATPSVTVEDFDL
jgi:hypothetical protein